jgi:hypothetical protein
MGESNETERSRLIAWLETKMKKAPIAAVSIVHSGRTVDTYEMEVGELPEIFAGRIWHDLEADADAVGGGAEGPVVYMLHLFRPSPPPAAPAAGESADPSPMTAEATRPIRVHPIEGGEPEHFGGDNERAQSYRHSERFAQIMQMMSQGALDRSDRENDRLIARLQRIDDQRWEDLERARRVALEQGELEIRKEEARAQGRIIEKAFEQIELLAPLFLSKLMGGDEVPGGGVERRLLKDFLATLGDQEKMGILAALDDVQRMTIGALAQGEIDPKFEAVAVQRLMASVTEDQLFAIRASCSTPDQHLAFDKLHAQRKKGLAYASHMAKLAESNDPPTPANGGS